MKVKITTLLFILVAFTSYSQNMNIEVLVGPNLSGIHGDWIFSSKETKPKIGFSTGIALNYNLKENLHLSIKGLFERKGCMVKATFYYNEGFPFPTPHDEKIRYDADYITLPVTIQYIRGKKIKYGGEVGVFGSRLLKQTATWIGKPTQKPDQTEHYERFDAGITLGIRTTIPLTQKLNFNIALLDNLGLVNTSKILTVRTNALNLFMGITIQL